MEAYGAIASFYEARDEETRLFSRPGQVELRTTMQYIERYLKRGMRVLEVGAGTGRYSHALAQRGYAVDAVELASCNIEKMVKATQPGKPYVSLKPTRPIFHF